MSTPGEDATVSRRLTAVENDSPSAVVADVVDDTSTLHNATTHDRPTTRRLAVIVDIPPGPSPVPFPSPSPVPFVEDSTEVPTKVSSLDTATDHTMTTITHDNDRSTSRRRLSVMETMNHGADTTIASAEDIMTQHTTTTQTLDIDTRHVFESNTDTTTPNEQSSSSFLRRPLHTLHTIHTDTTPINNNNSSWLLQFPENLHFFLWLCIQLSLSVTIANLTPAFTFDGSKSVEQFSRWLPRRLQRMVPLYVWGTTILLVLNVVASLKGST